METAVIIAGGKGSRLAPLTLDKPKTLVEVNGKPILGRILEWLKSYEIKHVVIGCADKKAQIQQYLEKNGNFGLKIDLSEDTLEGTAQAFKLAIKNYINDEYFLAMNGDELTNLDINRLEAAYNKNKGIITMALAPLPTKFSVIELDKEGRITSFEYGKALPSVLVSMGVYIFSSKILEYIPDKGSIEDLTFKKLVSEGKAYGYKLSEGEYWLSINTVKDVQEAEAALAKIDIKPVRHSVKS